MLREGIRGSDQPSIEPRDIAGNNFLLVRFLKVGREILWYWDLQHLIHIWGRVLKNLVKDEVQQVIHIVCNTKRKKKYCSVFFIIQNFYNVALFCIYFCIFIIILIYMSFHIV